VKLYDRFSTWAVRRQLASCGPDLQARNRGMVFQGPGAEVHVGAGVMLERGVRLSLAANARLTIGDYTYLADGTIVLAMKEISIGSRCAISWDVLLMDTSSHPVGLRGETPETRIAPILIGDHVWIGCRAVVLKGVQVGEGAIIANNAVVTRNVPPRTMVAGNPARVIKEDVIWE
jgi:acetyltransferase-like isoleucine patch superfamily enzyme